MYKAFNQMCTVSGGSPGLMVSRSNPFSALLAPTNTIQILLFCIITIFSRFGTTQQYKNIFALLKFKRWL